jgi:hypothetical protein
MELNQNTQPSEIANFILNNPPPGWVNNRQSMQNIQEGYRQAVARYLETVKWDGNTGISRGIITCAGGDTYIPCVWVLLNLLRKKHKCELPIELWYLGPQEINEEVKKLLEPFDVRLRDAFELNKTYPCRILHGWELKTYAIKNSDFKEIIYLDADNVPTRNPEFLFDTEQYKKTGAIMWGDFNHLSPQTCVIFGVPYVQIKERETGQLVFNKEQVWKAIMLSHWYNEHSDYYYSHVYGDKECIHMGFRRSGTEFADPPVMVGNDGVMSQHDFEGNFLFHHRNRQKWVVDIPKNKVMFPGDDWCIDKLKELAQNWSRTTTLAPEYYVQSQLATLQQTLPPEAVKPVIPLKPKYPAGVGFYTPPEDNIDPMATPTVMENQPEPAKPNSTSMEKPVEAKPVELVVPKPLVVPPLVVPPLVVPPPVVPPIVVQPLVVQPIEPVILPDSPLQILEKTRTLASGMKGSAWEQLYMTADYLIMKMDK